MRYSIRSDQTPYSTIVSGDAIGHLSWMSEAKHLWGVHVMIVVLYLHHHYHDHCVPTWRSSSVIMWFIWNQNRIFVLDVFWSWFNFNLLFLVRNLQFQCLTFRSNMLQTMRSVYVFETEVHIRQRFCQHVAQPFCLWGRANQKEVISKGEGLHKLILDMW